MRREPTYTADGMARLITEHGRLQAARGTGQSMATENGYCVKCKTKRDFNVEGEAANKNGSKRRFGACPNCGTKIHRFVSGSKK